MLREVSANRKCESGYCEVHKNISIAAANDLMRLGIQKNGKRIFLS